MLILNYDIFHLIKFKRKIIYHHHYPHKYYILLFFFWQNIHSVVTFLFTNQIYYKIFIETKIYHDSFVFFLDAI